MMRSMPTPLQAGMLSTLNEGGGVDDGVEFTLETNPRMKNGNSIHGFLSIANSSTQPKDDQQVTNLAGSPITAATYDMEKVRSPFYEFDQTNTISGGITYNFRTGASAGLSFMLGSGLYSSKLSPLPTEDDPQVNRNNPVRTEGRQQISEVNLRLATRPDWLYRTKDGRGIGLELSIENMFNSTARFDWRGPIAGTRYQQGRRIFLGVSGRL